MTDKDFDKLLKDALTCDEVPESLNESLVLLANKRQNKKAKILSFVKATSSCAAVFVCAIAVLSYFNSDLFSQKNTTPAAEAGIESQKYEFPEVKNEAAKQIQKKSFFDEASPDVKPEKAKSVSEDALPQAAKAVTKEEFDTVSQPSPVADTVAPEPVSESAAEESAEVNIDTFSMKRTLPAPTLDMLFNSDYDYKRAISERIAAQIALMDFPEVINFSQISGNEQFSLSEDNVLTIQFAAGTIAPEVHGDLFFTVGKVQNGVLE